METTMGKRERILRPLYGDLSEVVRLEHNPRLVKVVKRVGSPRGKKFNLVTPFAGKTKILPHYLDGIHQLPHRDAHAVFYDNSNSFMFGRRLRRVLSNSFGSYVLIQDKNKHFTAESTDDYAKISYRCHRVYKEIYENQIDKSLPLCLNVEDDVRVPGGAFPGLSKLLKDDEQIKTAVGRCHSRRLQDSTACMPIAWNFERVQDVGGAGEARAVDHRLKEAKTWGTELIGSAHMGLWLTETEVINELGMDYGFEGVYANDMCWGYKLNLAGYRMAIDWGLHARHYLNAEEYV